MKLTRNNEIFALVNIILVSAFYKGMDMYGVKTGDRNGAIILAAATLVIAILSASGLLLFKHENERQRTTALRLTYHSTSVIVIAFCWIVAYRVSAYTELIDAAWIAILGGGSLLAHWALLRNRNKGIRSKKAFL